MLWVEDFSDLLDNVSCPWAYRLPMSTLVCLSHLSSICPSKSPTCIVIYPILTPYTSRVS